jgi:CYTH domain-containing protein
MMSLEIERRFAVDSGGFLSWLVQEKVVSQMHTIVQGYLSDGELCTRVRIIDSSSAVMTIKKRLSPGVNKEIEFPLDLNDATQLMQLAIYDPVEKLRRKIRFGNLTWEIDQIFVKVSGKKTSLWIAEVELDDLDQEIEIPEWCTREITSLSHVSNVDIARDQTEVYTRIQDFCSV